MNESAKRKHSISVGDRVRVYGCVWRQVDIQALKYRGGPSDFFVGTVTFANEHLVRFAEDDGEPLSAAPQQCRRLKKRERRRVWITKRCTDGMWWNVYNSLPMGIDEKHFSVIEFVEVKRG